MTPEKLIESTASLSAEQAELLGSLLEEQGAGLGAFPLSFAQQRLWFLDQMNPGRADYNIAGALAIRGALDSRVLLAALQEIVRRHEVLRTVFISLQGRPLQVVRPRMDLSLPTVDLTGLPAGRRPGELERLARREAELPFDLAHGPLLRALLVSAGDGEHMLVLVLHHIISDGWSSRLLAREMAALYTAFVAGRPSPLPELPLQYADFAVWQQQVLRGPELERLRATARRLLAGLPALELPADHRRPAVRSLSGRRLPWALPAPLLADLRQFCEREGVTLFIALTAALAALLSNASGQTDLAIGTPSANRDRMEIEPLIGCFVNTLVLRADLQGEPGYRELARRMKRTALESFALRELPFEKLVEELETGRSMSHAPLVQAMLALQQEELPLSLPGLELRLMEIDTGTAKLDLTLGLAEDRGGLRGSWEYSTDLFEAAMVRRLAARFERLLAGALASPDRPLLHLSLLSAAESQQVLREWSDTGETGGGGSLHGLFEAQAERTPEALALVAGEERLSYRELDRRAEELARRLRALGVGPETRVGVFLERSAWLMAGLLGILKAGGAYVPLDPAYPRERVSYTLVDSAAPVVLTQRSLRERLPPLGFRALVADEEGEPGERPERPVGAGDLAYVIYTSGSTGRPKGVAIEHRSAVALLRWAWGVFDERELAGVFAATSICFDLSVFELFAPLSRGGAVILGADALALPDLPARVEVTLINTVPSAMAELLRLEAVPPSVRVVSLAGEPLRRSLVERIAALPWIERVLNLYGPSEDTTYSTWSEVPLDDRREPAIGRPVAGTRVRLLDPLLSPVPLGVPGELCLAGEGLARGYLGRPELTAERFVPDPWSELPGERLYRTGDLARHLANGEIEFLGRIDHQVKVRGFRIELGEIEAALGACAGVQEAVVLAPEDSAGDRRLVAWVMPRSGASPAVAELRAALRERLPEFMIPSAVLLLDSLPRTPNGKVDRKALPAVAREEREAGLVAPRGPVEELVAEVWSDLLGARVGATDDFFALGGHSLLAVRSLARLRAIFGVEIPVRTLFEDPTVRGLAARLEALRRAEPAAMAPIRRADRKLRLPLSFAQERLWLLDRLEPGGTAYNLPTGLSLAGPLDAGALRRAVAKIVRRHEALRTTFPEVEGRPVQAVRPEVSFGWRQVDLSALAGPQQDELARLAAEEVRQPFDLTRGPLLRAVLFRLAHERHALLLTLHHAVADGWSLDVFARELSALYAAFARGEESPLGELPVQYADFAVWQREWLAGEVLARQLAWWRGRLAGAPALLELPLDRPRPAAQSFAGARVRVELPRELTAHLRAFGRARGATPFMVLLAGFTALLSRWSGQEDLVVGSPVANRSRVELEALIGLFVNTLALRTDLAGEPGFHELLKRVREEALGAYAHPDLPFEKLVEELAPQRSLAVTPLFQVMFVLQNAPLAPLRMPGLDVEPLELAAERARFDLSLSLAGDEVLSGTLVFSTALFDAATIERMAGHFQTLLAALAESPEAPLLDLPLLSGEERAQLALWSVGPRRGRPAGLPLQALFELQARRTPGAPAVLADGEALSYGELDARADLLARELRALGVGPETRVGIHLERSAGMVVALLAALKAGGAYVPLDPEYPAERLAWMIGDAGVAVVLTEERLLPGLPAAHGARVLTLGPGSGSTAGAAASAPSPAAASADIGGIGGVGDEALAYVLYTSGSTGRPRGVMIPHRAIVNHMLWMQEELPLEPSDRVLQKTPFGFDASIWEFWAPLGAGATLVMARPGGHREPSYLVEAVARHGVTVLQAVPSLLRALLAEAGLATCSRLRRIFCGGEALTADILPVFFAGPLAGQAELINLYGPTETAIEVTSWRCARERADRPALLGDPITNARLHVLGRGLELCPVGVAGELCVGGMPVGRGYLGLPVETAARFVPDPFGDVPGARLYRTGDLVRRLPGGGLDYLGRIDFQVKVRGFRIELGEVEAALAEHPGVRRAVVAVRGLAAGEALVAWIVPEAAGAAPAEDLRRRLRERLPEHMVPAVYVELTELPLTPSGKVDRRALPTPEPPRTEPGTAPRTPLEELIGGIWSEMLGVERVGPADDFFDLGGHSLLAAQVASRLRETLGLELPLRTLFEASTLDRLAAVVEEIRQAGSPATPPPPLIRVPRDGDLPLSFSQERLWFLEQLEPGGKTYVLPLRVRLRGVLHAGVLELALGEMARRHEILRTTLQLSGDHPCQRIHPPAPVPLTVVDLAGLPQPARAAEADRLAAHDSWPRFDFERGPLLQARLLRLTPEEHRFLARLHHIGSDGWSMGVLVRDLLPVYEALAAGRPSPLPDLPIQYADFAAWQRSWFQGEALERQLAYWRERLEDGLPVLDLPTDRPRPAVQTSRGALRTLFLPAPFVTELRALGRRRGTTLFMTLLAAGQLLLARLSGQEDVVVGSPVAGRNRTEIEGLIGCFVNTLVLRTDLSGSPTFAGLLARVREVSLGAYSHQDLPFERLIEALNPQRDLSRTSLLQVFFNMLNLPRPRLHLPGLEAEVEGTADYAAKFDMTLYFGEQGDGLRIDLVYNADLFDGPRMEEMLRQLEHLLAQGVAEPERPVWSCSLVTAESARALPDPAAALSDEWVGTVHQLFARQAARAAGRLAIADRDESWTYGELDARSNRLAHFLRAGGVAKGDVVAIYAHRSAALVWGIYGVLKAGAAYTILDPGYPAARLLTLMELARPRALVRLTAAGPLPPALAAAAATLPCSLDIGPRQAVADDPLAAFPTADPGIEAGPDDLAFIAFTSGSTGVPKGVLGRHGPLSHFVPWQQRELGLGESDRFSMLSGLAHDPLQRDIFTALQLGASLFIPDPDEMLVSGRLAAWMRHHGITVSNLTPPMVQVLTEPATGSPSGEVRSLRLAFIVGEALTRADVARLRRLAPQVVCVNLYGATESQRALSYHVVAGGLEDEAGGREVVPLGRGMQDAQLLVLNRERLLAGVGEIGEIAIRSPHLAMGYLNDPDLTRERFLPASSGDTTRSDDRMYLTGDLGRYRPDGEVEFAGRVDHQVKIRGFRIEIGEIEARLAHHPAVRESAVLALDDRGEKRLVAFVVPEEGGEGVSTAELRAHLAAALPSYMVPAAVHRLPRLPLTRNGKLDRRALVEIARTARTARETQAPVRRSELEGRIADVWRELLQVDRVGLQDNLFELGAHSVMIVRAHAQLREFLGERLTVLDLFRYPTVASLAEAMRAGEGEGDLRAWGHDRTEAQRRSYGPGDAVAIVGMAGRMPQAADLDQFWENLCQGIESVTTQTDEELLACGVPPERLSEPGYVRAAAPLADADLFDAQFFGYSPREAEIMDPQHRLFLECAWEALEDAGYDSEQTAGAVGVFGGAGVNRYWVNLYSHPDLVETQRGLPALISNDKDFITTRVSYKLNLKGPSVNVQSACSTGLVALHLSSQSLLRGECDMALAGAVAVDARQGRGYLWAEGGTVSPDGHCRSFDAAARGTIFGNGLGVVVLKRLADAIADGDPIRAVVRGTAINNDGSLKVGFTAPSVQGQARVIAEAQAAGGVDPETVTYVEAHGSGTEVGDPIEVAALTEAFRRRTPRRGFCALGSVKTNIGHLSVAAGMAGLIKTVLSLQHGLLPPSLHFETPNPRIDFDASPFFVNTRLAEWKTGDGPRRAGVSAFGLGGTNAHTVLEEAPPMPPASPSRPWQLWVMSAATETALERVHDRLAGFLAAHPDTEPADAAFTLQVGRRRLRHRRILVARGREDALDALRRRDPARLLTGGDERLGRPVTFAFPGVGDHAVGMARGLYEQEPTFRAELDRCAEILTPLLGEDLRQVLFPEGAAEDAAPERVDLRRLFGRGTEPESEADRRLRRTRLAQPAVFAVEYALARLWMEWGVQPESMIGYSLGEYTAACLADVLPLADMLRLVAERARLIDELPAGEMLVVPLPEEEILLLLGDELSVAATSGPDRCVVAGPPPAILDLERRLDARGLVSQRLRTTHAFHSRMMEPIAGRFSTLVRSLLLQPPRIPYVSNVTGRWITAAEATDPEYWVRHLQGTVRLGEGLGMLLADPHRVLLEVGPGQALSTTARQHPERRDSHAVLASLNDSPGGTLDTAGLFGALGRLWLAGCNVDWRGVSRHERRRRVRLPTYPFERRRYWLDPVAFHPARSRGATQRAARTADLADWFHVPVWRPAPPPPPSAATAPCRWLVFADDLGLGTALAGRLRGTGQEVIEVRAGEAFQSLDGSAATIDPGRPDHYDALVAELLAGSPFPTRVVHLWTVTGPHRQTAEDALASARRLGLQSLLSLVQALERRALAEALDVVVVSDGLHSFDGSEPLCPEKAILLGGIKVISQEHRNIRCRSLDVLLPERGSGDWRVLLEQLDADLSAEVRDPVTAYRRRGRWLQAFDPVRLESPAAAPAGLRDKGVYLVLGAFGRIGRTLTTHLASRVHARLMLAGRVPLPDRGEWSDRLARDGEDSTAQRIRHVLALEELGAEVTTATVDVAEARQVAAAVRAARERFGELHGVIHLAGVLEPGKMAVPVTETDEQVCDWHFRPKVHGLYALEKALAGEDLDFCLLFSSSSAVLGGLGFAAYAAANAFMDAYVRQHNRSGGTPWLSVDWDPWRSGDEPPKAQGAPRSDLSDLAMSPAESFEAFHRVLSLRTAEQVLVSVGDLEVRFAQWLRVGQKEATGELAGAEPLRHPRPAGLQNAFVPPETAEQQAIARLWQNLLGIESIGLHDNFFELGGDSLRATQILSGLRRTFQVEIPLRALLEATTIAHQAALVTARRAAGAVAAQPGPALSTGASRSLADQLAELESLTQEDAPTLLDTPTYEDLKTRSRP